MDRWQVLCALGVGGFGTLTFLRIVGNELAVKKRSLELRRENDREEKKHREEEAAQERLQEDLERQQAGQRALVGKG